MNKFAPAIHTGAPPRGKTATLRIAIAGLGAIRLKVAEALDRGVIDHAVTGEGGHGRGDETTQIKGFHGVPPMGSLWTASDALCGPMPTAPYGACPHT